MSLQTSPIFSVTANQIIAIRQAMRPVVQSWRPSLDVAALDESKVCLAKMKKAAASEHPIDSGELVEIKSVHGMQSVGFLFRYEGAPTLAANLVSYRDSMMTALRIETPIESPPPAIIGLQTLVDGKSCTHNFLLISAILADVSIVREPAFNYCLIRKLDLSNDFYSGLVQVLEQPIKPDSIFDHPIEELGLPKRAFNALRNASIRTIGQVINLPLDEARKIHGLGVESLKAILVRLSAKGWTFGRRKVAEDVLLMQPFRLYWEEFDHHERTWLKRLDGLFIGDLVQLSPAEIRDLYGLHVLNQIERFLETKGLCLGMKLKDWQPPSESPTLNDNTK